MTPARGPLTAGLPAGFTVRLSPELHRADHGRLLVGGSPLTALRITDAASELLAGGTLTVTDPAAQRLARRLLDANLAYPDLAGLDRASPADLTVVIPARDRADQLDRTLAALRPLRCIVVDDASVEPRAVAAVAGRHSAELVALTRNLGPAGARNAGLASVTTPLVAFVDSDVTVASDALLGLTRHLADPAVALVGPRVRGKSRATRPRWFERYDELASSLDRGTMPASVRPFGKVAYLPSACLVGRTADLVLDGDHPAPATRRPLRPRPARTTPGSAHADTPPWRGDGFDPTLRVGEDVDLVWRLVARGRTVRYDPGLRAEHDTRGTLRAWLGRTYVYGTSSAELAARHRSNVAPAVLTPAYAVCAATLLGRTRWSVPAGVVGIAIGARAIRRGLPRAPAPLTTRLAVSGLTSAVRQEAALVLRHGWPLIFVAAPASRLVRRAILSAVVVDTFAAFHEHRPSSFRDALVVTVGRRLDDAAYGAGLWAGAGSARSWACLLPLRQKSTGSHLPKNMR
ncbi:MAG: glycosyltransferase [Nocardioidaceae bacterium]